MIAYYIGGPFDLTKRVLEYSRPRARLRVLTPEKMVENGNLIAKEHFYQVIGKLQFAEDTYIYEYTPENI